MGASNLVNETIMEEDQERQAAKAIQAEPKAKAAEALWKPVCKFPGYDFDEKTGKYLDSMHNIEIQQHANSKRIRGVVVPD